MAPGRHVTMVVAMAGVVVIGCNTVAATTGATKPSPQLHPTPSTNMRQIITSLVRDLHQTENSLAPLKTSKTSLERNFAQYRTHHGFDQDRQSLLQKALQFRTNVSQLESRIEGQFGPRLSQLQAIRGYNARDSAVDGQIAQSVNIYRRIVELLMNLIEVPAYIIGQLSGADSDEFGDSDQDDGSELGGDITGDYGEGGINGTD